MTTGSSSQKGVFKIPGKEGSVFTVNLPDGSPRYILLQEVDGLLPAGDGQAVVDEPQHGLDRPGRAGRRREDLLVLCAAHTRRYATVTPSAV